MSTSTSWIPTLPAPVEKALMVVGAVVVGAASVRALRFFRLNFLPGHNLLKRYQSKSGQTPYAVVTGASSGLGFAFSEELARRGFNLVLCGLSDAEMKGVVARCKQLNPAIAIKAFGLDFASAAPHQVRDTFAEAVQGLEVTFLVDNAGIAPPPARVQDWDEDDFQIANKAVAINTSAFTAVAAAVLPRMAQSVRTRGGIVFVSSASSIEGFFLNAVYAGTKSYARGFGLSVGVESGRQLDALVVTPFFFESNMVPLRGSPFVCSPSSVVAGALRAVGRRRETMGARRHELLRVVRDYVGPHVGFFAFGTILSTMISEAKERKNPVTATAAAATKPLGPTSGQAGKA